MKNNSLKSLFFSLKGAINFFKLSKKLKKIVFYSENGQDWHFFEPLIETLLYNYKLPICYLSSDLRDPGLKINNSKYYSFYIGNKIPLIFSFHFMQADLVVMTMGDLDNFHIVKNRNTKNPPYYIHIPHSPCSAHMIDDINYFRNFDGVVCTGPYMYNEIRSLENYYTQSKKNLIKGGYGNLDRLLTISEKSTNSNKVNKNITCLIAPSWGKNMIIETIGKKLISVLLQANINIILRPHPQTIKLSQKIIKDIKSTFKSNKFFSYQEKASYVDDLLKADVMISDWSGVAIEFALAFEKPVLFIDTPPKCKNPEYKKLNLVPIEVSIRNKIGKILAIKDYKKAPTILEELINLNKSNFFKYKNILLKNFYNVSFSQKKIAENLLKNVYKNKNL